MKALTFALAGVLCLGAVALAGHHEEPKSQEGQDMAGMPPMGPPDEMKQIEPMNGTYAVQFFYKMDPASEEWTETAATVEISMVAGGAAQQLKYDGDMMGMPFHGVGLTSYDRVTGKWQATWVDSMGARITMYTGHFKDGQMVVQGEDLGPDGSTYKSRLTTYNITDDGFDWKYEMSTDGTNYFEGAKATYTRK